MQTLGIPDVVVVEAIGVDLEVAVGIDVDVGNEEMCPAHSRTLPPDYSADCIESRT